MTCKSALITGGAGFLGSHLCDSLIRDDIEVFCIDHLGSGSLNNIEHLVNDPQFTFIEGDIRNIEEYPTADVIYHLASRASPKDFEEYPVEISLTNTLGTKRLLDHALDTNTRIVFASTSEVYGDPEEHPQTEAYNGNVNIRGKRGCYDEAKRFGETLLVSYGREYDIDTRTARIFNTYGPRMRPDDGRVVPTFIRQALQGENLTVYGDGTQTRSFCYVDDLVQGLRALAENPDLSGEVLNIGSTNEITINRLAKIISDLVETDVDIINKNLPEDDPQRRQPDITKAREYLEWEPTVDLKNGLKETIAHFESQELN